jgi:hypothetical protein
MIAKPSIVAVCTFGFLWVTSHALSAGPANMTPAPVPTFAIPSYTLVQGSSCRWPAPTQGRWGHCCDAFLSGSAFITPVQNQTFFCCLGPFGCQAYCENRLQYYLNGLQFDPPTVPGDIEWTTQLYYDIFDRCVANCPKQRIPRSPLTKPPRYEPGYPVPFEPFRPG